METMVAAKLSAPRAPRAQSQSPVERQPASNASTITIEGGEEFDDDEPFVEGGDEPNFNRADGTSDAAPAEVRRPAAAGRWSRRSAPPAASQPGPRSRRWHRWRRRPWSAVTFVGSHTVSEGLRVRTQPLSFAVYRTDRRPKHWVAFAALGMVWGTTWMAADTLTEYVPPLRGAAARFLLAALLWIPVILWKRLKLPRGRALGFVLLLSVTMIAVPSAAAPVGAATRLIGNRDGSLCSHARSWWYC